MSGAESSAASTVAVEVRPSRRPLAGLAGIFIAAMTAGLNNRVGALALPDVRGALGFDFDDASWLTTAYSAGELIAMPFSAWFAITFSVRRFQLWMVCVAALLAAMLPFIHNLALLLSLRFLQGIAIGTTIPVLMMAALKFLPQPIRLHGLALYAMTATFAPNLSIWLSGYWVDGLVDWRWVYWQIIPPLVIAGLLVRWGMPREPIQTRQFPQANWFGMACGVPALGLIVVALDQGVRLDWFNSPLIAVSLASGLALLAVFLLTEWYHPTPFIKLQILRRRNLGLGFSVFVFVLLTLTSGSLLPAIYLSSVQDYRPAQMASIGFTIALPQLVLGPLVALLLYRKWADARLVFAAGLVMIALACFSGMQVTADWNRDQLLLAQLLQALGQPMAVVALLFLGTSVVQPHEGPYVSGTINTIRAFGTVFGAVVVAQFVTVRSRFHAEMLLDHAASVGNAVPQTLDPSLLLSVIAQQALVLSIGDAYRALGVLALLLIPLVLHLTYIAAPDVRAAEPAAPVRSMSSR